MSESNKKLPADGTVDSGIITDGTIVNADVNASAAIAGTKIDAGTDTTRGTLELATDAETLTGTDTVRAVTPANVAAKLATPGAIGGTVAATKIDVDNIDLDGSTISYNGTGGITLNSDGSYNSSLQPSFHVYNSVTDSNATGNNTTVTIDFDTEVYDQGGDFASDTFTAPVTGKYLFTASVLLDDLTSSATVCLLSLVTSNNTFETEYGDPVPDADGSKCVAISIIAHMDAADTATLTVKVNGEGSDIVDIFGGSSYTYFAGSLIA